MMLNAKKAASRSRLPSSYMSSLPSTSPSPERQESPEIPGAAARKRQRSRSSASSPQDEDADPVNDAANPEQDPESSPTPSNEAAGIEEQVKQFRAYLEKQQGKVDVTKRQKIQPMEMRTTGPRLNDTIGPGTGKLYTKTKTITHDAIDLSMDPSDDEGPELTYPYQSRARTGGQRGRSVKEE